MKWMKLLDTVLPTRAHNRHYKWHPLFSGFESSVANMSRPSILVLFLAVVLLTTSSNADYPKPPPYQHKPPTPIQKPPPIEKPPTPLYKSPPVSNPTPEHKPPTPVYQPPKPSVPIHKPPTPISKPPTLPPKVEKPPVYTPPTPVQAPPKVEKPPTSLPPKVETPAPPKQLPSPPYGHYPGHPPVEKGQDPHKPPRKILPPPTPYKKPPSSA
ncbi:hypothetical protein SO802_026820 [Lithocarpus litseifolius]|uniref:Extensin n=1 Tax=Lithocarpus litseifolius TaxID=425828 RepID=A0AAW2C0L6_9ROSI